MRHPEVWFQWGKWELLHGAAAAGSASGAADALAVLIAAAKARGWKSRGNDTWAVAVLSLGMESLPDCVLLAQAQAEILERHLSGSGGGMTRVAELGDALKFWVIRSTTTLGFVLLQRLVRRHEGIAAARAVFSRAHRILRVWEEDMSFGDDDGKDVLSASVEKKGILDDVVVGGRSEAKEKANSASKGVVSTQQRMVTNRLKA